jgi:hypothetical protein
LALSNYDMSCEELNELTSVPPTPNGGDSWSPANTGLSYLEVTSLAIDPNNSQTIYAATYDSGMFKSTNSGSSWNSISGGGIGPHVFSVAIDPTSSQTLYASTASGLFKSTNSGSSWSGINNGLTVTNIQCVAINPTDSQTIYAGTSGGGVFKSSNGGGSWVAVNSGLTAPAVRALAFDPSGSQTIYAGMYDNGGVFWSTNGGVSWNPANSGLTNTSIYSIALDATGNIYAGTYGGGVFKAIFPTISGAPPTGATADTLYSFTPTARNTTSFSITNQPPWATFSTSTGALTGTPARADVGTYSNIVISGSNGSDSASLPPFSIMVTQPAAYNLVIQFSGSGAGMISALPAPPGIACKNGCSQSFPPDTVVALTPTAESISYFSGWNGCDQIANGICTVTMNKNRTIIAGFEINWPIFIGVLPVGFGGTLQGAYDSLSTGSNLLRLKAMEFPGDLNCGRDVQLTLQGGCNAETSDCTGMSTLKGSLTVSSGSVQIGNISFR